MRFESFNPVCCSLADIVGKEYLEAVCEARAALSGDDIDSLLKSATQPVEFFPDTFHKRLLSLTPKVGEQVCKSRLMHSAKGATTTAFQAVTLTDGAPINGFGYYRVGEDGRLYMITKSEHYHAPVGHAFPGYALIEHARRLGIPNATHNNTRGHITRLLEEALVHEANGGDETRPDAINRVLNLETGSLATEAAFKMLLARFYRSQTEMPTPKYEGKIPVFLVLGNNDGLLAGNYHGTTIFTQMLRGMWPELYARMADNEIVRMHAVRPNSIEDLNEAFRLFENNRQYKIAGFFHEIVMMNYGALPLSVDFLQHAYALCQKHDVPTVADEIQSCLWTPGLFLFREYGLHPTLVAIGKGFPGGEYPASRLLFNSSVDNLAQFGALVTNGQEELASLAYLITMEWAKRNQERIRKIGAYYGERIEAMAAQYPGIIYDVTGHQHLRGISFRDIDSAVAFVSQLRQLGFDISAQTYKIDCPPVVLTKIPIIVCPRAIDFLIERMDGVLRTIASGATEQAK